MFSTTNHANDANGEGNLPEKSRLWLPFFIRDIRFIRSAGCSVLLPADPCSFVKSGVVLGPKRRKGPDFVFSTTKHANDANGEGNLPEKSRLWLPFFIRDIRFIRSAGCSVLFHR